MNAQNLIPPKNTLGALVNDVARMMRRSFETTARRAGLTLTRAQWQVIANLARCEGINQAGLAEHLDIEPITLVGLLDRLQALDLVERRPDPGDRRARLLFLTERAHPLLLQAESIAAEVRETVLGGLDAQDRAALTRMLLHVRDNLAAFDRSPDSPAKEGARESAKEKISAR